MQGDNDEDIARGIDVVSWTGKPNISGTSACTGKGCPKAGGGGKPRSSSAGVLGVGVAVLSTAAGVGRRRRED